MAIFEFVQTFSSYERKIESRNYLLVLINSLNLEQIRATNARSLQKLDPAVTTTILQYQTRNLPRIKGNHRNFLNNVFTNGELLYKKDGFELPKITAVPTDYAAKENYWQYCMDMANDCLKAEAALSNAGIVSTVLLRQATEMVLLGLIYSCLDCRPGDIGLRDLLNLCALFMPEADEVFPADGIALRVLLSSNPDKLHYRSSGPSEAEVDLMRIAVMKFIDIGCLTAKRAMDSQRSQSNIE